MARASSTTSDSSSQIRHIVGDFVGQLSTLIEQDAVARARQAIMSAFSGSDAASLTVNGKRRGRPPGSGRRAGAMLALAGVAGGTGVKKRKKAPIQLCPVPGCTNRAAPVFGMVCSKHKDLPKAEIRKFREARRAKRDKARGKMTAKAPAKTRARRKPVKRKARAGRSAPRSATPPAAKAAATA